MFTTLIKDMLVIARRQRQQADDIVEQPVNESTPTST